MLGHELIGGELSIPPDEGETDEQRRATFSIPGGGDDGGGGAVDDAAAICPSLNGKASVCLLRPCRRPWGIVAELLHAIACRALGSAPFTPAPTALRPTARPSASSARCSQDGPMVRSTATATSAPPPLTAGSGTTTVSSDTQPSATSPRSLVLTREEPTFSG